MEVVRERWTDDRMDDLVVRVDNGFAQADARFAELRAEQIELRKELADKSSCQEVAELRSDMNHRFDRLQNMMLTGFATLLILTIVAQIG
jgi:hypothetical protein